MVKAKICCKVFTESIVTGHVFKAES